MRALIRIKKTFRPVSGELIGFRLQACTPNLAARKMLPSESSQSGFIVTKKQVPSFTGKHLIASSMDYAYIDQITPAEIERFQDQKLRWLGYSEFERIDLKPEKAAPAAVQAEVDRIIAAMNGASE